MAQKKRKSPLTFEELKAETQKLAAYLSTCAKQPVEIRVQGHAGLAYTHSIEDDGKKHVIPMVLNPICLDDIRTRERAITVWWGLGAHELAHHLWPAAKFYEKAYEENFGRLFNLIDDEQNERRGRSEHPEWGEWFQSVMPLAFPKKKVFEGTEALTGGFGEENSWIKPGGFIADNIYITRSNQFGYFLRRHNSEPHVVKDKTVAAALALIPARLKDLTKEELFELTRRVHEVLCRGINKPKENVRFQNKPKDPTKKAPDGDGTEGENNEDGKPEGEDKDGKDKKPKERKEEGELKQGEEKPEGEAEETEEEKKKREEEEAERKKAEEEEKKRREEEAKKKKEEKEKKDGEKKSWNPKKLLTSKWLLIPLAAFLLGWLGLFSMAGTNFWLQIAFFIGQVALIVIAFIMLRWGAIRAFLAWMKRKELFAKIRRFFLQKSVRVIVIPLVVALLAYLAKTSADHFGLIGTCIGAAVLIYVLVLRKIHKLSIASASGAPPPSPWLLRSLSAAALLATGLITYALSQIVFTTQLTWIGWTLLGLAVTFVLFMLLATMGGIQAIREGAFGIGAGKAMPGIGAILKACAARVFGISRTIVVFPFKLLGAVGLFLIKGIGWTFKQLWAGVKFVLVGIGKIIRAIWRKIAFAVTVVWRYIWWALSIAFRWVFTMVMRAWWFVSPTLKRLWKHTWFRLFVIAAIAAAIIMMGYAVLLYVAQINFWLMVLLIVLLLILLLLAFLFRKKLMKFIINEILQPMPALMRQFMAPPLDMTTDWFVPIDNVQPTFTDQAWLDRHMPEIIALAQQLRPIFANCGFSAIDREDQPDGFDLIDEIELALIGESSIFIDDETVPKASLHIEYALDCSGSMGFATRSLGPGEKFELGKLMGLAIEHAIIGLPGVTARFWGFRNNTIFDCGTPGQRRMSGLRCGGGNNDSAMLWHMGQGAARSGKNMKLLLMASDGMPAECSWLSLRNLVLRFEQAGMIPWNFGLDVIETRAFKNFTDLVGQSKPQAIQTFGRAMSTLASEDP